MEYKKLFEKSVRAAESNIINPYDLECHWYVPWNIILVFWFHPRLAVSPQYYTEGRDGNDESRKLIPDFVVMDYYTNSKGQFDKTIRMIVENKRSKDNVLKAMEETLEQLDDQVSVVFLETDYEWVYGIAAVGRYGINIVDLIVTIYLISEKDHGSYTEDKSDSNFVVKEKSGILDILEKEFKTIVNKITEEL